MKNDTNKEFLNFILERFKIEREKFDGSGVYAYTQRLLAYNSKKIEGSTLTEEQPHRCLIMERCQSQMTTIEQKTLRK